VSGDPEGRAHLPLVAARSGLSWIRWRARVAFPLPVQWNSAEHDRNQGLTTVTLQSALSALTQRTLGSPCWEVFCRWSNATLWTERIGCDTRRPVRHCETVGIDCLSAG